MQQIKQLVYMRQMPSNLIAFSSKEGKKLFKEALDAETMECYFPLAEQFITQLHPTTCGSTTLVMVLNALKIDPEVQWKGIWRWYTEENLHGLKSEYLESGIDLDELSHIAKHNKVAIETFYHPNLYQQQYSQKNSYDCMQKCSKNHNLYKVSSETTFYTCLEATSRMDRFFMIVNNSRQALGQTGEGHFSPIGGINIKERKAMLFDVARFKYPPQWCAFDLLYKSIAPIDKDNNMTRGFGLIGKSLDYDCQNLYSKQYLQNWMKTKNDTNILPHQLSVLMVYYLFILLQRIEQGITNIQTEHFQLMLREESRFNIDESLNLMQQQTELYNVVVDFVSQYPNLSKTISCFLYNLICGYSISHRELIEEYDLFRLILGI